MISPSTALPYMPRPVFSKQDRVANAYQAYSSPESQFATPSYASNDSPAQSDRWSSPNPPSETPSPPATSDGPAATHKKKHVCPTCHKAFTTSGHLSRHARVHTGERNHKCPFPGCDTRCSRQDNLQQHYRIHLSPGSRRNSSTRTSLSQVLTSAGQASGGIKKRSKPSSVAEESSDSPPSTPPALELAFVSPVYSSSEPSPGISPAHLYHRGNEKSSASDMERGTPSPDAAHPLYFDFRAQQDRSFHGGHRASPPAVYSEGINGSYSSYGPSSHALPPSSELALPRGLPPPTEFGMYESYSSVPLPELIPSQSRSSVSSLRPDPVLEQPQPHFSYLPGQQFRSLIPGAHFHASPPASHSDSPSPVSSLSISSHGSDHSSLYHDRESPRIHTTGIVYAPTSDLPSSYSVDRYHSPPPTLSGPGEALYARGMPHGVEGYSEQPWPSALGGRVAHDPRGPGARFVL